MTTWNYRVIEHTEDIAGESVTWYGIHEVYYDDNKPTSCTIDPMKVVSESVEDMKEYLAIMMKALDLPVINEDVFIDLRLNN